MKKIIFGIIFILILGGIGVYSYSVHNVKTFRVCIGNATNTTVPCNSNQNCLDEAKSRGIKTNLTDAPEFIRENFPIILNKALYCNKTCFVQKIRGFNPETKQLVILSNCNPEETEFLFKIKGKDWFGNYEIIGNFKG